MPSVWVGLSGLGALVGTVLSILAFLASRKDRVEDTAEKKTRALMEGYEGIFEQHERALAEQAVTIEELQHKLRRCEQGRALVKRKVLVLTEQVEELQRREQVLRRRIPDRRRPLRAPNRDGHARR